MSSAASDPPERPITPDDIALVVRLMADPEARRRMVQAIEKTYLNPEMWRAAAQAVQKTYLNPEMWQLAWEGVQRTYLNPEMWQRAGEAVAQAYSPESLSRAAEAVAREYRFNMFGALAEALDTSELRNAANKLESELKDAEAAPPQPAGAAPLAWWLASRTLAQQTALLVAALAVLDKLSVGLQNAADVAVPQPVRDATEFVFAIAAFLLLWFDQRSKPS